MLHLILKKMLNVTSNINKNVECTSNINENVKCYI